MSDVKLKLNNLIVSSMTGRRFGKTTALVEAANKIGATFVCASRMHEKFVKGEHKVKTTTSYQDLRGTQGPYIWDHFTIEQIAGEAITEIDNLLGVIKYWQEDSAAAWDMCEKRRLESGRFLLQLEKAIRFLKEGKAKFAPNTTNSLVDEFIADYEKSKKE